MGAKRLPERKGWPTGLGLRRGDYFVYNSSISGRQIGLGKISKAEAFAYANWANRQAADAKMDKLAGVARNIHLDVDDRGLFEAPHIIAKAVAHDRICGVYFLLTNDEIVYVGKSTDIMTRLANHKQEATKEFGRVFVIECPEANMHRLETLYIDKFRPKYNISVPKVSANEAVWSESVRKLLGKGIHSAL